MNAIVWRDEIYERAPDFKARVASARFRSAEWRFLAALDGRRTAGEIADELKLDPVATGKLIATLDASGTIVPALLSIEEFERVAGLLLAGEEIERDFPEAGIAALRESYETVASDLPPPAAAAPAAREASPNPAPPSAPTVDASVGAAFETLRKMRQRARNAAAAETPPSVAEPAPGDSAANAPAEPAASAGANGSAEARGAQASLVESLALAPKADEERAIVHRSANMIPLASVLERVQPNQAATPAPEPPPAEPYDSEADAAAWNAILERTRNGGTNAAGGDA